MEGRIAAGEMLLKLKLNINLPLLLDQPEANASSNCSACQSGRTESVNLAIREQGSHHPKNKKIEHEMDFF